MGETKIAEPAALLTVEELAAQLGLSVSAVYRRRSLREPLPPAVKLGGRALRWRQSDVDAWIEERLETAR